MKIAIRIICLLLAMMMLFASSTLLIGCGNNSGSGVAIDNESTRLVLSTSELDGVFNPRSVCSPQIRTESPHTARMRLA